MRERFQTLFPRAFFLDVEAPDDLTRWLHEQAWIDPDATVVSLASAGPGNMNLTLRATLSDGDSLIIKQSRPWVEKYPQFDAPSVRAHVEARFYEVTVRDRRLTRHMANLIASDARSFILALQDLGPTSDLSDLYGVDRFFAWHEVEVLLAWLAQLHQLDVAPQPLLYNQQMRALNYAHIFQIPLDPNNGLGISIGDGLKGDAAYVSAVHRLGEMYLWNGSSLNHGDFYPGSFARTGEHLSVIDPEFCFLGRPEFDVGVFVAHWLLSGHPEHEVPKLFEQYEAPYGFEEQLARQFAGVEIMRRILGVAQLPLTMDEDGLRELLHISRQYVLS